MKNVFRVFGIIALVAAIVFSFAACDTGSSNGGSSGTVTLSSIAVTTQPSKLTYEIGEQLDTTGMVVTATYSDNTTKEVTGYTTSGFSSTTSGTKTVTVTYQGKTASFYVTINANIDPEKQTVAKPDANPPGGLVSKNTPVTLSTTTPSAEIWYTKNRNITPAIDGEGSIKYTGEISVTPPEIIKAIAFRDGWNNSPMLTVQYDATAITIVSISIPTPIKGASQSTEKSVQGVFENFSAGDVSWSPAEATFRGGITYTATVTLTADAGYAFGNLTGATARINDLPATITNNTGKTITLSKDIATANSARALTILTQPTKLTYTHGEKLDLSGLVALLEYDDGSTVTVTPTNWNGVTTVPANETPLAYSLNNGHPVILEYGTSLSANTSNLTVSKKSIADADVTVELSPSSAVYTSAPITKTVSVTHNGTPLTQGTTTGDFTVTYDNNTNAGNNTAVVTITANANSDYTGTRQVHFSIGKADPVTLWPQNLVINYNEALSSISPTELADAATSVAGNFSWVTPGVIGTVIGPITTKVMFTPTDTVNYDIVTEDVVVTVVAIPINSVSFTIVVPMTGALPSSAATPGVGANYTCSLVTWSPQDFQDGKFKPLKEYTASVTLTANTGYAFASDCTVQIGSIYPIVLNHGSTLSVSHTYKTEVAGITSFTVVEDDFETNYVHGDELDLTGLVLSVVYDNGDTTNVDFDWEVAGFTITPAHGSVLSYSASPISISVVAGTNTASLTKQLSVSKKDISTATVSLASSINPVYTGSAIHPSLIVTVKNNVDNQSVLTADTDYSVSGTSVNAGSGSVSITGNNNYEGSISPAATFTIDKRDIGDAAITPISAVTYNGSAHTPSVTVTFNGPLTENTDFTVTHSSNTNAGLARVTIVGEGNFTGSSYVEYTIQKADPVVSWPTAQAITYGTKLSEISWDTIGSASLGSNPVAGDFDWVNPNTVPDTPDGKYAVIFNPTDTVNYNSVTTSSSQEVEVVVTGIPITAVAVSITAPATGGTPQTAVADQTQFTGDTINWTPTPTGISGSFVSNQVYTAGVTLTAKLGYTFTGLVAGAVTVNGYAATVDNNTGGTLSLSYTFDETGAASVTNISIKTSPTLTYQHGDSLDLSALEVTLHLSDSTTQDVTYAVFGTNNLTVNFTDGIPLSHTTHDNQSVTVIYGSGSPVNVGTLVVSAIDASLFTVTSNASGTFTYNGIAQILTISKVEAMVGINNEELVEDDDYTVSYSDNTSAGTATCTIAGIGNFTGTKDVSFTISKATPTLNGSDWPSGLSVVTYSSSGTLSVVDLSSFDVTSGGSSTPGSFSWTDPTTKPTVAVTSYEVTFTPADSTNFYTANQNVSLTVNARNYNGSFVVTLDDQSFESNPEDLDITVVDDEGATLVLGSDYDVAYDNDYSGSAPSVGATVDVTITFKGNYSGTASESFEVL